MPGTAGLPRAAGTAGCAHLEQAHGHLGALGAEPRVLAEDPEAAALAVEQVLVELEPHVAEGVRRVVRVADPLLAPQRSGARIERRADDVIGALLPVLRPRHPAAGADAVRRGQLEPPKHRGVRGAGGRAGRLLACQRRRPEQAGNEEGRESHAVSRNGDSVSRELWRHPGLPGTPARDRSVQRAKARPANSRSPVTSRTTYFSSHSGSTKGASRSGTATPATTRGRSRNSSISQSTP